MVPSSHASSLPLSRLRRTSATPSSRTRGATPHPTRWWSRSTHSHTCSHSSSFVLPLPPSFPSTPLIAPVTAPLSLFHVSFIRPSPPTSVSATWLLPYIERASTAPVLSLLSPLLRLRCRPCCRRLRPSRQWQPLPCFAVPLPIRLTRTSSWDGEGRCDCRKSAN
jgi:hypothetical protein